MTEVNAIDLFMFYLNFCLKFPNGTILWLPLIFRILLAAGPEVYTVQTLPLSLTCRPRSKAEGLLLDSALIESFTQADPECYMVASNTCLIDLESQSYILRT